MARIVFDPVADAATFFILDPVPPAAVLASHICDLDVPNTAVVLDLDGAGQLISIEILGATALLPPAVLGDADRQ